MTRRIGRGLVVGTLIGVLLGVPSVALAAEAAPSIVATAPYNLDFTLPTDAKSGCMVCHGDPALVRVRDGVLRSYYISDVTVAASAHADQQCVGCHVDFTYSAPHGQSDWTVAAKSACRNCHDEASIDFQVGVHRTSVTSTATATAATAQTSTEASAQPKPLCGDCHGAHDISWLATDTPEAKAGRQALHRNGWEVCGRCHEDYWDSYDDYYHGAAYKRGALDAPSCWDCHGWHDILPSKERGSLVNEAHLAATCGGENLPPNDGRACHVGVDENYIKYAGFIHGREEVAAKNPILSLWRSVRQAIGRFFGGDQGR
jgi:hypothetical protein